MKYKFGLAVASLIFAMNLTADTVELKTGERIDGTFRQAGVAGVVIEIAGQSMTIPMERIQAIYFGAPKPPSASAAPALSGDALDALRALRSVTASGITYRDYAPRVLDARVKVDRYLGSAASDNAELKNAIGIAMHEYELASNMWNGVITDGALARYYNIAKIQEDPKVSNCPAVQQAYATKTLVENQQAIVWSCAAAQVTEAEHLLAQPAAATKVEAPKVVVPMAAASDPVSGLPRAHIANQ